LLRRFPVGRIIEILGNPTLTERAHSVILSILFNKRCFIVKKILVLVDRNGDLLNDNLGQAKQDVLLNSTDGRVAPKLGGIVFWTNCD
jgi:hypothetical protein